MPPVEYWRVRRIHVWITVATLGLVSLPLWGDSGLRAPLDSMASAKATALGGVLLALVAASVIVVTIA